MGNGGWVMVLKLFAIRFLFSKITNRKETLFITLSQKPYQAITF